MEFSIGQRPIMPMHRPWQHRELRFFRQCGESRFFYYRELTRHPIQGLET
jgi:hypothetical protein